LEVAATRAIVMAARVAACISVVVFVLASSSTLLTPASAQTAGGNGKMFRFILNCNRRSKQT